MWKRGYLGAFRKFVEVSLPQPREAYLLQIQILTNKNCCGSEDERTVPNVLQLFREFLREKRKWVKTNM